MGNLVLWGHHVDDYQEMFDLTPADLAGTVLEYSSGPSAFNAERHEMGRHAISCDPLFGLDKPTLTSKVTLIFAEMLDVLQEERDKFEFGPAGNPDELIKKRQQGMAKFFADYIAGKREKRYVSIQEVALPFPDFSFDLVLTSHYLFAGLDNQDLDFHVSVIKELARVAKEVRIFPIINRDGKPSDLLGPVLLRLQEENYGAEVKSVSYRYQPKGNAMLRIWSKECRLSEK